MYSGYLESRTSLETKIAMSLDRFEIANKSNIKLKEKIKV